MSFFLEFLRCILCCVEDHRDENGEETFYGNTSWETIGPFESRRIFSSSSSNSQNFGSPYAKSVERIYDVPSSSISYTNSVSSLNCYSNYVSSYSPHTLSSRLLQPSSKKSASSSSPTPASSSNQSQLLSAETPKPSPLSKSSYEAPKLSPSLKPDHTIIPEVPSSSKPSHKEPSLSFTKPPTSHSKPSPSFSTTATSSKPVPGPPLPSYEPRPSSIRPPPSFKQTPTPASSNVTNQQIKDNFTRVQKDKTRIPKLRTSNSKPSLSSKEPFSFSPKAPPTSSRSFSLSFKSTLAPASSNIANEQKKAKHVWLQKDASPTYVIPEDVQDLIKKNQVPEALKRPLSMQTYKDYFAALLYAEDFFIEKWGNFELKNITLKLQEAEIFKRSYRTENHEKDEKTFFEFKIDLAREDRPFILSRDFVFARPSGSEAEPFQGIIYRVVKSNTVLVEFGDDFHSHHYSSCKYDISFSFNRVCLKRAHQAIEAASDPLFKRFIFPDQEFRRISTSSPSYYNSELDVVELCAVREILNFQGGPPYLIDGPSGLTEAPEKLSKTGLIVQEAVLEIYRRSQELRVLICAPSNSICDLLTRILQQKGIPESDVFRANATFRDIDDVLSEILPSCAFKGGCFTCPPLHKLQKFRVILSTYVSSFRLYNEGIAAGHFSHIFMLNASSVIEPEAMIPLANLANKNTAIIVTGSEGYRYCSVHSDIARRNGLMTSYFQRLVARNPYKSLDPMFITRLQATLS